MSVLCSETRGGSVLPRVGITAPSDRHSHPTPPLRITPHTCKLETIELGAGLLFSTISRGSKARRVAAPPPSAAAAATQPTVGSQHGRRPVGIY